jgi:hypothetical protein
MEHIKFPSSGIICSGLYCASHSKVDRVPVFKSCRASEPAEYWQYHRNKTHQPFML